MANTAHELESDVDPWEHLPLAEMQAIEMRYEGKSHKEISEALELPLTTVQRWFKSTGKLLDAYTAYAAKQNELIRGEATNALKGLLKKAVKKLGQLVDSQSDKVALGAVQEVLDRELGKPTQPIVNDDSREIDGLANDIKDLLDQFDIQNGYKPFAANPNGNDGQDTAADDGWDQVADTGASEGASPADSEVF